MPSADTGSAFSEGTTERILFTSESVGEGHPGDYHTAIVLCILFIRNIIDIPSVLLLISFHQP